MVAAMVKRLASLAATLAAVSMVIFLVMNVLPGDPAAVALGTSAQEDTLAALRHEMGLDQPLPVRYVHWVGGAITGDFGTSATYGVPVRGLIADRLAVTLPLAGMAILLSMLLALPLGILAASRQNGAADWIATIFSQLGVATPNFWIGLLLILVFSTALGWMPSGGFSGWNDGMINGIKQLFLPAVALALPQAGVLTRVTRAAVLDVLSEDFVRTARAKGLNRRQALFRHVVPNALAPVVTILGLQFSFLVAGAVLVENVFTLPGLGRLAYQAFTQRDFLVVQNVVLFIAALVVVVNFLVDLLYLFLDPRLRSSR
ncbi:ABC transporter permease [Consotaella salsifontis]|uniref:Peptide/nickel transport system permease protein n=1 Tax=Consotaella salsifontis TaxID=1365950 RepID=A0A1T4MMA6_9HYPH|nr:ABC transporter permease [Consotaella salsifontis]SJZ68001.1 peptide/nickel transport system permease protein [Consotaella salsifontis]